MKMGRTWCGFIVGTIPFYGNRGKIAGCNSHRMHMHFYLDSCVWSFQNSNLIMKYHYVDGGGLIESYASLFFLLINKFNKNNFIMCSLLPINCLFLYHFSRSWFWFCCIKNLVGLTAPPFVASKKRKSIQICPIEIEVKFVTSKFNLNSLHQILCTLYFVNIEFKPFTLPH